ncbi:hypothetical protein AC579_9906 [Pseudocercospora musae]|uniref:Uncharacterized protein n=1 Tax=Pseudocercospora musae TaxID=113226 RepID=A0A139IFG0_9PEZI|nr:hypothetical protein AC579_9906 [Pseudocercospora musae]
MSRGYSDGSDMHEQSVHENFDVQRERHKPPPPLCATNPAALSSEPFLSGRHHLQGCSLRFVLGFSVLTSNRFAGTRETAVNCCSLLFTSLARERKKRAAKIVQTFSRWPSHCLWASVTQADHLPTFNTSQIDLSGAKKMKLDSSISTALAFGFSIFGFVAAAPPCIHIGKGPCIPHDVGYKAVGKTNKPAGKPVLSTETLGTIGIINNEMASPSTACTYGPLGCKTKRMQLPGPIACLLSGLATFDH